MPSMQIELTDRAYLILPAEIAEKYFPSDNLVALERGGNLWLLPVNNKASGGLLLKRRNSKGDRAVLLVEILADEKLKEKNQAGIYAAHWDSGAAALLVDLNAGPLPAQLEDNTAAVDERL